MLRTFFRPLLGLIRGARPKRRPRPVLVLEQLETRDVPTVISPTAELLAASAAASPAGLPAGLSPAQVRQAYGFNQIAFGSVSGNGAGQTIAIIDAYDQPNIANDLATFDATYGIAAPPSFTKVNESGGTALPASNGGWGLEISLDVEWAHAIAPGANILLVEASSSNSGDLLAAENYARTQPGVSVVSMSWGAADFTGEASYDSYFATPSGHTGVTFVASSGDDGSAGAPLWPSVSPNVLAVGGTQLATDANGDYLGEAAWSGSGGGLSTNEAEPGYQKGVVTQTSSERAVPDVAYNASSGSAYAVYDTLPDGSYSGWIEAYGTSAGAPQWAGLIAIADQGRALAGEGTLDGGTQTLPALYQLPASDFHDITSGGNGGYSAGPGYDLVTGRGTPVANLIVAALVGSSSGPAGPTATVVTVSDLSGPYTGNPYTAVGSVTGANGATLGTPAFAYYSVAANGNRTALASAPVVPGNYLVVASYAGSTYYTASSASVSFTISQAAPNVEVRDAGGAASGAAYTAAASVTGVNGASLGTPSIVYYAVAANGALTVLASAPSNPGNYLVTASYAGSAYYTAGSVSAAFSITPPGEAASASYLAADFKGQGVWRYAPSAGWQQLAVTDATQVAVDDQGDVVAAFQGQGVWRFENGGGWRQLTLSDAAWVGIAGDGIVAGEFTGYGVWRYEDDDGWRQLTVSDAAQLAVDAAGDVAGSFTGYGVWRYEDVMGWQQLTSSDAAQLSIAGNGIVAGSFTGYGVWRYQDGAGWQQLTTSNATQLAVDAQGDVAGEFQGYGVWLFQNAGGWRQLTNSNATQVALSDTGAVAAEFSSYGVWLYDNAWQQLASGSASLLGVGA